MSRVGIGAFPDTRLVRVETIDPHSPTANGKADFAIDRLTPQREQASPEHRAAGPRNAKARQPDLSPDLPRQRRLYIRHRTARRMRIIQMAKLAARKSRLVKYQRRSFHETTCHASGCHHHSYATTKLQIASYSIDSTGNCPCMSIGPSWLSVATYGCALRHPAPKMMPQETRRWALCKK
jgi:hypothetical protein